MPGYAIITPVRDEEQYIEATIASVLAQNIRPVEWVIVNDGSTDRTGEIVDRYAFKFPFIRAVHRRNRGFRKSGGGVMEAFYEGYGTLQSADWDFLIKLDGDLTFAPDYFENCFRHFDERPKLGIGGGEICHDLNGRLTPESSPGFHVRGATKIYRRACWETIGGLWKGSGWDTIDEIKANMSGWETRTFQDVRLVHHRLTGTADGLLRDRVKYGLICFTCGYHPVFVLARCFYRMFRRPFVIGSLALFFGYVKAYFTQAPRVNDRNLIRYVRTQQMRRLFGLKSVWR